MTKIAGSGSEYRSIIQRHGPRTIIQRHGSADPDSYQNVMDLLEVHLIPAPEEGEGRESQPAADALHAHPLVVGEDGASGHAPRPRLTRRPRHQPVQVLHFVTLENWTSLRNWKFELPASVRIRNTDPDLGVKMNINGKILCGPLKTKRVKIGKTYVGL
jgi:hypothetical protein